MSRHLGSDDEAPGQSAGNETATISNADEAEVQRLLKEIEVVNQETKALQVAQRIKELEAQLKEAKAQKERLSRGEKGKERDEEPTRSVNLGDPLGARATPALRQSIEEDETESLLSIRGVPVAMPVVTAPTYKRQHAEKPRPYQGKNVREYEEFVIACGKEYDNFPEFFKDPGERIRYAVTYLASGPSYTWEEEEDINNHSWETFKDFLLDQIDDKTNRRLRATIEYEQAQMGKTQPVQEFVRYLETLEKQLEPKTLTQKRDSLLAKLPPKAREKVVARADSAIPESRKGLVAMVRRIQSADDDYILAARGRGDHGREERNDRGQPTKRRRDTLSPPAQESAKNQRRDNTQPSQASSHAPISGGNTTPATNQASTGAATTCRGCGATDHVFRQCPKVRCFRCQREGHISTHCPNTGNARA